MPKDNRLTFTQNLICGGNAGVICRTVCSPLDVVKTLQQVGIGDARSGMLSTFVNQYKNEGIRAFWKGNAIASLRGFPYYALQFAAYEKFKNVLSDKNGKISPINAMVAGSAGGVVAVIATYPMDMVKTRLTAQHADLSKAKYKGIVHAFKVIAAEEGALSLYKGMGTSIIGVIPFAGATFMAYEILEKAWKKPKSQMTPLENFIDGCLAGAFAQTLSYPFDTIRKKLQAQSKFIEGAGPDVHFNGMIDGFVQTVRSKGVLALWNGTTANLIKVMPYAGIMFMSFEMSKRLFLYNNGYTSSPFQDSPLPDVDQSLPPSQIHHPSHNMMHSWHK
ncbi:unnamed protein product [Dimorphilus gyrociliatus]|uniref:Uncharacterized protein n=1 Tax=Dimorphilus gyrociliatus TaxID=2664684 RepID=A0A7I8V3Y7_9ANNE|nr:unnamed protein product [Dimorphilus gyrociliatus]